MRLHLVDGTYELFRSYFGAPKRSAPDGREVGATVGLLLSLLRLIREEEVSHLACAFDHVIESFRNDLYPGYKTSAGIDPQLLEQFGLAERAAAALGVVVWPMVEFEADDAMASAAHRFQSHFNKIVLCSPDKDLAQCVLDDRVVCLDRRREKVLDRAAVQAKFGVSPESIPDWLALVGDSADGFPGIARWGAKSSALVLAEYGHLESIPRDPIQWPAGLRGRETLASNLFDSWEDALLFRRLATLRRDVPLREEKQDLKYQGASRQDLEPLCSELGERGIVERITRWKE